MHAIPGRPREFTYEKRRELIEHIGQGATVEEAAQIVGVTLRTVQRAAKHNEHFHHDLHLAIHAAPVDPHQLMLRAARTHWRAAAWLLERTDPDRFAKRPPNSCRPETLREMNDWLIETALEATPPEHREAVYHRMRSVADKAYDVLMPDQHEARRSLVGALPHRPMPLSDHEIAKTLEVLRDRPDSQVDAAMGTVASDAVVAQVPRTSHGAAAGGAPQARPFLPPAAAQLQEAGRPAESSPAAPAPQATAGRASSDPPNGGIMSPKMTSATNVAATEGAAIECETAAAPTDMPDRVDSTGRSGSFVADNFLDGDFFEPPSAETLVPITRMCRGLSPAPSPGGCATKGVRASTPGQRPGLRRHTDPKRAASGSER